MLLNERLGGSSFLVFLLNINSCACLVKSGLKIIFHSKAQLLITVTSLRRLDMLDWMSLTTEKREKEMYRRQKVYNLKTLHLVNR